MHNWPLTVVGLADGILQQLWIVFSCYSGFGGVRFRFWKKLLLFGETTSVDG